LKEEPHELALGMTLGIFTAMLPIMPFHMALAVALALFFRVSKITAAIGCFVSNPFNWYILYLLNYKIGAFILGLSGDNKGFSSLMKSLQTTTGHLELIHKFAASSGIIIAAFIIGGLIMGIIAAFPSYFIFLKIFTLIKDWHDRKRIIKNSKRQQKQPA
jgi:uncharacterized protein